MDSQHASYSFLDFRQELDRALPHLYDPTYLPDKRLARVCGIEDADSSPALRNVVVEALEALKPPADVARSSPVWRMHDLLSDRYVLMQSHKETATHLGISQRHLSREQAKALDWLARYLWQRYQPGHPLPETAVTPQDVAESPAESAGDVVFRNQVRQEFLSLRQSMPDATADVAEVMQSTVSLWPAILIEPDLHLQLERVARGLLAAVHPTILRQLLITAVQDLADHLQGGSITVAAGKAGHQVVIRFAGEPAATAFGLSQSTFLQEMLEMLNGTFAADCGRDTIVLEVCLPFAEQVRVLVIDDNVDLVHFYRRYVEGTRFVITEVHEGRRVWEAIAAQAPDVIVLDVMLPDTDGWQLLIDLHQDPAMRTTPIIVCSVVKQAKLAITLGAASFVPKPVRRQEFVDALEQASMARN